MATITTSPIAVASAPVILTVDDLAINAPVKSRQVILVPTTPDELYGEDAIAAWHLFVIEGETTRFVGAVTEVRLDAWIHEFVGEYVDHEREDEGLFVANTLRRRDAAARSVVREYYSQIWLSERRYAYQARAEALAEAPGACQIDYCGRSVGTAHVIVREHVYSACAACREEYELEVATAA